MAGRDDGSRRRWRRARPTGPESARRRVALGGMGGPWQWRRKRRRRRAVGCFLWVLTLVVVLLVLSILFGGFRRGARVGDGPAHVVRAAQVQDTAR